MNRRTSRIDDEDEDFEYSAEEADDLDRELEALRARKRAAMDAARAAGVPVDVAAARMAVGLDPVTGR